MASSWPLQSPDVGTQTLPSEVGQSWLAPPRMFCSGPCQAFLVRKLRPQLATSGIWLITQPALSGAAPLQEHVLEGQEANLHSQVNAVQKQFNPQIDLETSSQLRHALASQKLAPLAVAQQAVKRCFPADLIKSSTWES